MWENFDTSNFAAGQRIGAWRDIVCDVYTQLDCRSDLGSNFYGSIATTGLGTLNCSQIVSTAQKVRRTPERISRARDHHVLIAFADRGRGYVQQDGKELVIEPGEFALYDTSRPYELRFDGEFRQTILKIPRERVLQRLGGTERVTAIAFSSGNPLEKLAMDFVKNAVQVAKHLPPEAGAALSNQIVELLALTWANRLSLDTRGTTSHRSAMLMRLKAYIDEHLADPEFSIADAAQAMGVSVRTINSLLGLQQTSFRKYVLSRRLEMCRKQLSEPALTHIQISEMAFSWGFNDLAYFSRCFREHFQYSPREWRRNGGAALHT